MTPIPRLCHRDGHARSGDCVHRRTEQRNVEPDPGRQTGTGVGSGRQHVGRARNQQNVIKGKGFAQLHRRNFPIAW